MARSSSPAAPLYPKIRFAFTDHPITIWVGALLLRLYFELIGLRGVLQPVLAPLAQRSHHQIPVTDVLWAWFYGRALGAERFAHCTRDRRAPLLAPLLGLARLPSPDPRRRFFLSCTYGQLTMVAEALMRASLARMPQLLLEHTRDLASTVLCRDGGQAGSQIGSKPQHRGRPSHHPLLAVLSATRRRLWGPLRFGKAGPANGCSELLQQADLPPPKWPPGPPEKIGFHLCRIPGDRPLVPT